MSSRYTICPQTKHLFYIHFINTVLIKLYDLFRKELNLSDEKAKAFVEAIDEVISEDVKHEQPVFKSWFKEDFQRIDGQLNELIIDKRS
jgi:hypothetical protein